MPECPWEPEAYPGVPLAAHNAAVAAAVDELLGRRLRGAGMLAAQLLGGGRMPGGEALWTAAVLAGSLHDAGKASPHYQGRGSYYGHELVGAAILLEAANAIAREGGREAAVILALAAWAVARHHAAMRGRHPSSLASPAAGSTLVGAASEALASLAGYPDCLRRGLPADLRSSKLEGPLLDALGRLASSPGLFRQALRGLASFGVSAGPMLGSRRARALGVRWMAAVASVAGALIVADVLVAGAERRATDEGGGPAYAAVWLKELGPQAGGRVRAIASARRGSWPATSSLASRLDLLLA